MSQPADQIKRIGKVGQELGVELSTDPFEIPTGDSAAESLESADALDVGDSSEEDYVPDAATIDEITEHVLRAQREAAALDAAAAGHRKQPARSPKVTLGRAAGATLIVLLLAMLIYFLWPRTQPVPQYRVSGDIVVVSKADDNGRTRIIRSPRKAMTLVLSPMGPPLQRVQVSTFARTPMGWKPVVARTDVGETGEGGIRVSVLDAKTLEGATSLVILVTHQQTNVSSPDDCLPPDCQRIEVPVGVHRRG